MERQDYLTTAQVADLLHMKRETLARQLSEGRGRLVGVKVGRQWLIRKDTVDALLEPPRAPQGR